MLAESPERMTDQTDGNRARTSALARGLPEDYSNRTPTESKPCTVRAK